MPQCSRGCGTQLKFDTNVRSKTGKMIPLEMDGTFHQCPNSQYNQQQQSELQSQQKPIQTVVPSVQNKDTLLIKLDSMDERITKLTELYSDIMNYLVETTHVSKAAADKAGQCIEQARITDAKIDTLVSRFANEKLRDSEIQYDQDKEDGSLGSFSNED